MRKHIVRLLKHNSHGLAQFICFCKHISIEEYFPNDTHRSMRHLPPNVDDFSIFPALLSQFSIMHHCISIAHNMTRLKRRSHQFALLSMKVAFTDKEAMPKNWLKSPVHGLAFIEIISMLNQKLLCQFRRGYQHSRECCEMQASNI